MMSNVVVIDGEKLLRLRLGEGLTQIQLAKKAGVSPDTVVRWEAGKGRRPQPGSLSKLAKALGVKPADLFED